MKRLILTIVLALMISPAFAVATSSAILFDFLACGLMDNSGSPLTNYTVTFYDPGYAGVAANLKYVWTNPNRIGTYTTFTLGEAGQPPRLPVPRPVPCKPQMLHQM